MRLYQQQETPQPQQRQMKQKKKTNRKNIDLEGACQFFQIVIRLSQARAGNTFGFRKRPALISATTTPTGNISMKVISNR